MEKSSTSVLEVLREDCSGTQLRGCIVSPSPASLPFLFGWFGFVGVGLLLFFGEFLPASSNLSGLVRDFPT